MRSRLTPSRIQSYRGQGYLVFDEPVFDPGAFTSLKRHIEERLEAWTEALGKPLEMIDWPHFVDPKLNEWLLDDSVIDLVEPLIGPDIALFACSFITKLPGASKAAPWHEDATYWGGLADRIEGCTDRGRIDDLDILAVRNPEFVDLRTRPHCHGYQTFPDGTVAPKDHHYALKINRDGDIYITTIYPFALLRVTLETLSR